MLHMIMNMGFVNQDYDKVHVNDYEYDKLTHDTITSYKLDDFCTNYIGCYIRPKSIVPHQWHLSVKKCKII